MTKFSELKPNETYIIRYTDTPTRTIDGGLITTEPHLIKIFNANNNWYATGKVFNLQISESNCEKIYSLQDYPELFL